MCSHLLVRFMNSMNRQHYIELMSCLVFLRDNMEEEEDDAIYANTDMYPESSTKEHLNPGWRAVEGQSDEDEQDNIYAN